MAEGKGGNIGATLSLDSTPFTTGLDKAQKKAESWAGSIQSALGKVSGGNLGGAFGLLGNLGNLGESITPVAALTTGITMLVQEFKRLGEAGAETITQQGKFSARFEMATGDVGALQLAAERYGVTQDSLNTGMAHFERQLGAAQRGAGEARAAFAALGLTGSALERPGEALRVVIDRLAHMSAAQRELAAQQIFGRAGAEGFQRIAVRGGGAEGLDRTRDQGLESGAIASAEQVEQVRALNHEMRESAERIAEVNRVMANNTAVTWLSVQAYGARARAEAAEMAAGNNQSRYFLAEQRVHERTTQISPEGLRARMATMSPQERMEYQASLRPAQLEALHAPAAGGAFDHEQRGRLNEMLADLDKAAEKWEKINTQQGRNVATLGMNRFELQRYELTQDIIRTQQQLESEAMEQATAEERAHVQAKLDLLKATRENSEAEQVATELQQDRIANLDLEGRIAERNRHLATPQARARAGYEELQRAEAQLGLNQPTRQAGAVSYGSSAAIAAVTTARLQQDHSERSVQERMASAQIALLEVNRAQQRAQEELVRLMQQRGGNQAAGPAVDDIEWDVAD